MTEEIPYESWSLEDMITNIGEDKEYRVPSPRTNVSPSIISIMYKCLEREPANRPSFSEITVMLENVK